MFSRKNTYIFQRKLYVIFPFFGQLYAKKKIRFIRGKPLIFGPLRKNQSTVQRARGPLAKTGFRRKRPGLVNKQLGETLTHCWVSPSSFGRCRGRKSACHVFSNNPAFFYSEQFGLINLTASPGFNTKLTASCSVQNVSGYRNVSVFRVQHSSSDPLNFSHGK